jgi:regulatory protein
MSIIITLIEPQKRRKNRYSIYAGDEFITGISDQTLLEFNLHTGQKLTQEKLIKINNREEHLRLREYAFRYLARRAHSTYEMRLKLSRKGFDKNNINQVIHELIEKKYLDDEHFARVYIQDEIRLKKTGPLRIRQKLREKGIDNEIACNVIDSSYPEKLQSDNALQLAEKKIKNIKDQPAAKIKAQLASYLKNKGYNWQITTPILQQIIGDLPDETN